ncbi:MAG: TonB-dependent receptor [Acidobacteriia bacterium]|nr:TonB-dependent receptor [Terriglobia bacterium]
MAKQITIAVIVSLCICLATLTPQSARAQAVYGGIIGTVTDPQGAAVANAKVTVLDEGKGTSDSTTTNESGNYSAGHLIAGTYTVRVEAPGFKVSEQKGVLVNVDSNARVDLQFQVGGTSETVEVTGEAPQLKTDRADVAVSFNEKYVEDLPILNRNFTQIQLLSPGSQKLTGWSHAATENPQGGQQIFSQGQHFSGTGFELDGTDNQDPILGIIVINPNLDAVTEAKVALQNYDAEFGKAVASLVTGVTKSGSNQLHGSGFYFLRSDGFQARDPFTQDPGKPLPKAKWQQFGGTVGGAIIKDKLFFFGDYQGTRQTNGISSQFSLPTALAQSTCNPATNAASVSPGYCNLSDYIDHGGNAGEGKGQIFDPGTGTPKSGKGGDRTPFGPQVAAGCASNCIPIGMISPQAGAILAKFSSLTLANTALTNNFVGSGSGPFTQNSFDTRIDYNASASLSIFGRYSLSHYSLSGKGMLGDLGGSGTGLLGLAGSSITHNQSLATGFNKTFSSSLLMDFRFGYFKYNPVAKKPDGGTPMNDFGIGVDGNLANTDDPKTAGLGFFDMENVLSDFGDGLGVARCNCPLTESEQQFQFVNNWTKVYGNHQFKFGADIRYAMNFRLPSDNNRTGEYGFHHNATSSGNGGPNSGHAEGFGGLDIATFLLGDVTQLQRYTNNPAAGGSPAERQKRWFFYGQDTWRASSKLTINYGLRWEIYFPETVNAKGAGGFANIVDLGGTGAIRVAGTSGIGTNGNVKNDFKAFAPRLGIAYQLTPKTVVRMGYGRSYDIGVFGSNFGHTVTQNLPVLLKQNLKASNRASGDDDYNPIFTLADGPILPNFHDSDINSNGLIPFTALKGEVSGTHIRPERQVLPAVDAWNATVQRQITNTISTEVSYVGSKGTHGFSGNGPNYDVNPVSMALYGVIDPNTITLANPKGSAYDSNLRRPLCRPVFGGTPGAPDNQCTGIGFDLGNYYGNDAASTYNAFEVKVDKRFAKGLQFLTHYTFSHANNYDSNYYAIDHRIAWGPVDFNRNHVFVLNTVYELPFGKGKTYMGDISRGLDFLVGGWQLSNTTNWSSGLPWTPKFSDGGCNAEQDVGICRPNKGTGSFHTGVGDLDPVNHSIVFFTPISDITKTSGQAFADPTKGNLGNIGRNSFHGPAGFYSDLSVSKNFSITERVKAKFVMDAFNVFNHPVYAFSANNGANNCIDCANAKASDNNGKITSLEGGTSMRALQWAIRFDF